MAKFIFSKEKAVKVGETIPLHVEKHIHYDSTGRVDYPCRTCDYLRINEDTRTYYCILLKCRYKQNMDILKGENE